jgi:flagellar biosynthesis/type III secretory pathway protein FliH
VIRRVGEPIVVRHEELDARGRARAIVGAAEARAADIVAAAERHAAGVHRRSAEAGYADGRATAAHLVLSATVRHGQALEDAEQRIMTLATEIAARLLNAELEASPEKIRSVVAETLQRATRAQRATITVHPDDAAALRDALDGIADTARSRAALELAEDPRMSRGGCIVRTDVGTLDGQLETRISALRGAVEASSRKRT